MITSHPCGLRATVGGPKWDDMQSTHAYNPKPVSRGRVSAVATGKTLKITHGGAAAPEPAWGLPGLGLAPACCQGWPATSASPTQPPRNQHPRWQRRQTGKNKEDPHRVAACAVRGTGKTRSPCNTRARSASESTPRAWHSAEQSETNAANPCADCRKKESNATSP